MNRFTRWKDAVLSVRGIREKHPVRIKSAYFKVKNPNQRSGLFHVNISEDMNTTLWLMETSGLIRIVKTFTIIVMVPVTTYQSGGNPDVQLLHRLLQDSGDIYNA